MSFVSEIKVLNDEGEVIEQATEPKRYTYLLGEDEKVRTPSDRLSKLVGKTLSLNDILEAFSVEALNEEFYKIIAHYFYQLIGGKIGKGKKATDFGDGILQLPSVSKTSKVIYQEFAVRLIGKTIFSWFLKMKKSDAGEALLPESLLSSKAVKNNTNYYHSILERVFFQTLNTKMKNRVDSLPQGCEEIPFLNGGLFEPDTGDYYRPNRTTGISENINTLKITDDWFFNLFTELEKYNFTIDENSVTDVEVSVDPEMLGRIFENLLAEIDPDSGETARKATGSFYTPREIVDYMATESLVQYLNNKTDLKPEILRPVFKMTEQEQPMFSDTELESILDALDKVKILDPACGSGAFPMGVLQKIVMALQKLDPDAEWWKERQVKRITNQYVRKALREKLEDSSVEYARKIGVIQNSLYGVDIQPIAAEISKLRCFLSLVVDETINENKPNRGIEPLPNLEFKFVTADTLQKLPEQKQQRSMFDNFEELQKLEELRTDYLQSSGKKKEKIKEQYIKVQTKMFKNEMHLFTDTESRAYKLSSWNPFSHDKADWFDPKWMYGVDNFDIVIGNPPYVQMQKDKGVLANKYKNTDYKTYERTGDIYTLFYERGLNLLVDKGILTFITSNKWMRAAYGKSLRHYFSNFVNPLVIVDFGQTMVFKSAIVHSNIILIQNSNNSNLVRTVQFQEDLYKENINISHYFEKYSTAQSNLGNDVWAISDESDVVIKKYAEKSGTPLSKWDIEFYRGILTGLNDAFIITDSAIKDDLIKKNPENENVLKPVLRGRDTRRYYSNFNDIWLINTHNGIKNKGIDRINVIKDYPNIYDYLLQYEEKAKKRQDKGDDWTNLRNCAYIDQFESPKIIFSEIVSGPQFHYDTKGYYPEATVFFISGNNLKYLIALLNSKPVTYIFKKFYAGGELVGKYRYKKSFLLNLPIPKVDSVIQKKIETLVDYLLYLNNQENKSILSHTSNSRIAANIDEVLDMMIFELYFGDHIFKKELDIITYVNPKPLTNSNSIEEFYLWLQDSSNPVRNRIIASDLKSPNIVGRIKSSLH